MIKVSARKQGICNFHQLTENDYEYDVKGDVTKIKYDEVREIRFNSSDNIYNVVQICEKCALQLAWELEQ